MKYGTKIATFEGNEFYSFPSAGRLAGMEVEKELRGLGFGYRAKFIQQTAQEISENKPKGWLDGLRKCSYEKVHSSLCELSGVGAKVADCVSLMSLDKFEAVPIDTHVWQIAIRDYRMKRLQRGSNLNKTVYNTVADAFRELWGSHAGWVKKENRC